MEEPTNTVTSMSEDEMTNSTDAAAEITDAMMSSLADVVKTTITPSIVEETIETETPVIENTSEDTVAENQDSTVADLISEGEAAHRSADHQSALKIFNKAIALDPSNSMAWFNRGVLLEAEQDPRGARQSFVICLDLDPNHGPALANLAVLLDRLGENDGAVEIAHRALQYFPGHPHLVNIMNSNKAAGGVLHTTPQVMPHTQEKLVDQNVSLTRDQGGNDSLNHEGSLAEVETVLEESIEAMMVQEPETPIEEAIEEEAIDVDNLCSQATELLINGDAKGALAILKEHLHGVAAQHFESWKVAAGAMAASGYDDHAIGAYTHAIGLDQTNAKCFFNLGALHERKENYEAAGKCFASAIDIDPSYAKAALRLANISQKSGDIENLLKSRRALIDQQDGKETLALLLVELAEGEAKILENTAGLPPTIPEGPALAAEAVSLCQPNSELMGRALSASGNHTDAVKCWKSMIQQDKNNPILWTGLARSLEAAGDLTTAQRCHEKASLLANPAPATEDPLDAFSEVEPVSATPVQVIQDEPESNLSDGEKPFVQDPPQNESVNDAPQQVSLPELSARPEPEVEAPESRPEVDLAAAALEAASRMEVSTGIDSSSNAIANHDIEWYNKGVGLIEDKKYKEALSCFDRALPSFADNDEMVIRILNGRGNALYYLEDYPKCVESYHKAMVINPGGVQGKTLYNMGTAYAEMQRFGDAIKCFEQAMPRGLDKDQQNLAKEQIRRCNILLKEQQRKMA